MKTNIDTKELEIVKSNTNKAVAAANELVVESQDDMLHATELLSKINKAGDMIKAQKEAITKPLNASLAAARELFKPLELIQAEAKSIVSRKMIDFQTKFEAERAAQEAKIVARVEKGTLKIETAVRKVEALEKVENKVEAVSGSVTFKEVRVPKVIDENLLPREYLEVNMVKVRKDALAGVQIPGVVVEIEKQLSNSR
jgi:hypothetical protein